MCEERIFIGLALLGGGGRKGRCYKNGLKKSLNIYKSIYLSNCLPTHLTYLFTSAYSLHTPQNIHYRTCYINPYSNIQPSHPFLHTKMSSTTTKPTPEPTVQTITPEEATARTGYASDGTRVKQFSKEEEERMNRQDRRGEGLLAALCVVM